jgi:hypothetical protein
VTEVAQHDEQQKVYSEESRSSRRDFLRAAGTTAAGIGLMGALPAFGQAAGPVPESDIAVLRFLAAAELLEDDLWQQYCELAVNNPDFNAALRTIDPALIRYICDDRDDERSHANLINGYLMAIGREPVNLDPFRTLPSSKARGAMQVGRLTNLTNLNVDTSWYARYRSAGSPDFGDQFPQIVNIAGRPTVPVAEGIAGDRIQAVAHSAAFHFAAIEQGGGSLYNALLSKVNHPDVVAILASIGPTEVYHFAAFHKSLEGLYGLNSDGLSFPDLKSNPSLSQAIFPEPCRFLRADLPLCSVIRPRNPENAGAVAAATGLVKSGLFTGQSQQFLDAVVALATAADAAKRI